MQQLGQFIINHWSLWLALTIVLVLIFINEQQAQKKQGKTVSPEHAVELLNQENAQVIDLRDSESFRKGHIINAIQATTEDFEQQRLNKYKAKPLILVCARGTQSAPFALKLKAQGFSQLSVLHGGMAAWIEADLPVIKGK